MVNLTQPELDKIIITAKLEEHQEVLEHEVTVDHQAFHNWSKRRINWLIKRSK